MSIKKGERLLDEVKDIMRLKHYSIRKSKTFTLAGFSARIRRSIFTLCART
ncbi:MAG TPA: hypothetical protein ACFYD7_00790 [Candidatus Wujingus californicus]|uniref:hypothetical protein n=1 Tax=Candidatus Wujingus californicus TaxID=3367618 RepID=UPI001E13E121|nr:hypothetical protein [Planctomycetota bacterium]MDO8130303.1 hypothetical protein [Candidatus Brocadiales bacterium]